MAYALDRTQDAIFVERLHAKTLARGLEWVRTEHDGRYQVQIGDYVIEIGEGDEGEPEILVCDADGKAIEILTPDLLGEPGAEGAPSRRRQVMETYEAARRLALGVDEVFETLIKSLV